MSFVFSSLCEVCYWTEYLNIFLSQTQPTCKIWLQIVLPAFEILGNSPCCHLDLRGFSHEFCYFPTHARSVLVLLGVVSTWPAAGPHRLPWLPWLPRECTNEPEPWERRARSQECQQTSSQADSFSLGILPSIYHIWLARLDISVIAGYYFLGRDVFVNEG